MNYKTLTLIPPLLKHISHPPKELYCAGEDIKQLLTSPVIAIVGTRKPTAYGRAVTQRLARELAEQGVVIVSGLAFGVDAIAHQSALDAGGRTIAVLPSSLDIISPSRHTALAGSIVEQGGALLSEYRHGTPALKQHFIARNRLIAGLAQAVLITEAGAGSGSLHTARFAFTEQRPVLVVPGNITSPLSAGSNDLLKTGAYPVMSSADILDRLKLKASVRPQRQLTAQNPAEQAVLQALAAGPADSYRLLAATRLPIAGLNQTLIQLELRGYIARLDSQQWAII